MPAILALVPGILGIVQSVIDRAEKNHPPRGEYDRRGDEKKDWAMKLVDDVLDVLEHTGKISTIAKILRPLIRSAISKLIDKLIKDRKAGDAIVTQTQQLR